MILWRFCRLARIAGCFDPSHSSSSELICKHHQERLDWPRHMSCYCLLLVARAHQGIGRLQKRFHKSPWCLEHARHRHPLCLSCLGFGSCHSIDQFLSIHFKVLRLLDCVCRRWCWLFCSDQTGFVAIVVSRFTYSFNNWFCVNVTANNAWWTCLLCWWTVQCFFAMRNYTFVEIYLHSGGKLKNAFSKQCLMLIELIKKCLEFTLLFRLSSLLRITW